MARHAMEGLISRHTFVGVVPACDMWALKLPKREKRDRLKNIQGNPVAIAGAQNPVRNKKVQLGSGCVHAAASFGQVPAPSSLVSSHLGRHF